MVCDIYDEIALWFDANRGKDLMEKPYLDALLEPVGGQGCVLDLGCGTGEPLAAYIIGKGLRVTGVDGAARMVALCRERFPGMEWLHADMRGLALGRQFDAVLAWDSFFHLTQEAQRGMFPVFAAHAKKGARLLFTSGPEAGEVWGHMNGHEVYHASLDTAEFRALLEANGFAVLRHTVNDAQCGGRTVWLAEKQ